MNQNRLNTNEWEGGIVDTPETTINESVSTEYEMLEICRFERPETYTFEMHSGLRNSVDRLVVDVVEVPEMGVATVDLRYEMIPRMSTDTVIRLVADGDLTIFGVVAGWWDVHLVPDTVHDTVLCSPRRDYRQWSVLARNEARGV